MLSAFNWRRMLTPASALGLVALLLPGVPVQAQQTGSIAGKVSDDRGTPVAGAQVSVAPTGPGATTEANGSYLIEGVAAGAHTVRVRMIGYRPQSASVTVAAGQRATHDFTLVGDPLNLEAVVVTGTNAPRTRLETSNATTVLSASDITRSEEHTSELQSRVDLVCRLLLEKK